MLRTILLILAAAAAPALAQVAPPAGIAPQLRVGANEVPAFALRAEGTHVYECRAVPGGYAWTFLNPDATLYDGTRSVGIHAAPNLWESSSDRSSVSGRVRATQPAGAENLPWALLGGDANAGSGLFAGVTSIQRVNTSGGVAPTGGCTDTSVGTEARVAFRADYYFYKRRAT
ncbi:MAG TPA: DUF3455 domain-containing protein [Usitatibacter sp.]|nr:DUF3455 domain-containing protein [Usitatibacter sp.]